MFVRFKKFLKRKASHELILIILKTRDIQIPKITLRFKFINMGTSRGHHIGVVIMLTLIVISVGMAKKERNL